MSATDPDNDTLRYLVDWDGDGTVDEIIPATGYVPSGTAETASRTYSMAGTKTIKVAAQDVNGNVSGWATLNFNCTGSAADTSEQADLNNTSDQGASNSLSTDLTLSAVPSLVSSGATTHLNWSSTNMSACTVTATNGDTWTALQSILGGNVSKPITGQAVYTLTCLGLDNITKTKTATVNVLPKFEEK